MRASLKPFLLARHRVDTGPALGRSFAVLQETWNLQDDPKLVRPKRLFLTTRQTASGAADAARDRAAQFAEHGFHKPSGAWWGSDGSVFHRFLVTSRRPVAIPVLALAGGLAVALGALRRRSDRRAAN